MTADSYGHDDWKIHALCSNHPRPDYWFPDRGDHTLSATQRTVRTREAKTICNMCPVFYFCREEAVQLREGYGIRAGQDLSTTKGRQSIRAARQSPVAPEIAALHAGLLPPSPQPALAQGRRENGPLTA